MASHPKLTAEQAYRIATNDGESDSIGVSSPFICPFDNCRVYANHFWGMVSYLVVEQTTQRSSGRYYKGAQLVTALCQACSQEIVLVGGRMVWPLTNDAPQPAPDLPAILAEDYREAAQIYKASPRGAAALLRLLLQKLCAELGATEGEINKAIGGFVAAGRISPAIQKALDAVRVIGNEAVHPGEMDLRDDVGTVVSLFGLVNFIVEKMITEPKQIDAIYDSLPPRKLAGIANRDG